MKRITMPAQADLVRAVNEILARYVSEDGKAVKLTLRQIYYQLVAKHIIENCEQSYKALSARLVKAREDGTVDDSRIEDRNRQIIGGDYDLMDPATFYQDHENSFRSCWERYSRPMWWDQPRYVEVFVEKDALSRLVSDVANKYGVVTCVAKGYSSYTFLKDAAERINNQCNAGDKDPVILYAGDLDPSGVDMVRDLGVRLERYGVPGGTEIIHRVALTREQVEKYNLPPAPVKEKDSRAKKFVAEHGDGVVELDALDPDILQKLIETAIVRCINADIWNLNAKESRKEQQAIKEQVDAHFARD